MVIWPDDVERPAKKWSNRPNRHLFRSCGPRRRRAPAQCWWTLAGLEWGPGRTKSLKPPLAQQCKASFHLATGLLSPQDSGQEVARKASVIAACKASFTAACKPSFTAAQKASITAARKASFTAARKIPSTAARKASLEPYEAPFRLAARPHPGRGPSQPARPANTPPCNGKAGRPTGGSPAAGTPGAVQLPRAPSAHSTRKGGVADLSQQLGEGRVAALQRQCRRGGGATTDSPGAPARPVGECEPEPELYSAAPGSPRCSARLTLARQLPLAWPRRLTLTLTRRALVRDGDPPRP